MLLNAIGSTSPAPTCSSSLPDPRFSTSISKQRDRKARKTGDNFSGLWSSGVPLVAIKYSAYDNNNNSNKGFIGLYRSINSKTKHSGKYQILLGKLSPWEGSHWDMEALLPPSLSPWSQETRCPLLARTPSWSQPLGPSSTACPPWCCVCSALGWSGRRSRSQLWTVKQFPGYSVTVANAVKMLKRKEKQCAIQSDVQVCFVSYWV